MGNMSKVAITPGSPEHQRLISPSKVAAILGVSRWQSQYSCWHEMRGNTTRDLAPDLANTGHAFERALAELWRLENPGWRLSPNEVQFVGNEYGFPFVATIDRRAGRGRDRRVVEFKTARDLEEFGDPNLDGECPTDYAAQCITQMLFAGPDYRKHPAHLMVMGPFFKHRTYEVAYEQPIADWIIRECRAFWDSLVAGIEPELDDSVPTYKTVKALHPDIDGTTVEVPPDLIVQIRELKEDVAAGETKLRGLKTQLLDLMGNAQTAEINGEKVARRQPGRGGNVNLFVL
jgi:predicted phage-related endonuclease